MGEEETEVAAWIASGRDRFSRATRPRVSATSAPSSSGARSQPVRWGTEDGGSLLEPAIPPLYAETGLVV
jgi:hypothetical protein